MKRIKYKEWTLIDWDGNPELKLQCWRKSFRRGHVSIGVGDFKSVVYSYGHDSDESLSGTRGDKSEKEMMAIVDKRNGYWKSGL